MSNPSRLHPLNILDAEWRKGVWKRWLRSRLAGDPEVVPPAPSAVTPVASAPQATPSVAPPAAGSIPPSVSRDALTALGATRDGAAAGSARDGEGRRSEVRARFDALFDRMLSLEDTLDALGKRFTLRAVHERRNDQRVLERLENTVDILERQSLAIEATTAAIERIEQRVERLERWLRADGAARESSEPRESRAVPARGALDEFDELEHTLGSESRSTSRMPPADVDGWDEPPFSASSIRGNLAEMSLPTVLAMLELERRTGVLKVCADDGTIVSATLRDGSILAARQRDVEADAVDAIREALRFVGGHFWFRQAGVEVASGPARSVGSVLLEATRRNDEAVRSA